jgi:hypothetical protein
MLKEYEEIIPNIQMMTLLQEAIESIEALPQA